MGQRDGKGKGKSIMPSTYTRNLTIVMSAVARSSEHVSDQQMLPESTTAIVVNGHDESTMEEAVEEISQ
jgi:hypothetical protein